MTWKHGLYCLNSRYYNPTWGRFLNSDGLVSTGQGLLSHNMYLYCNNNPINLCDPTGNASEVIDVWRLIRELASAAGPFGGYVVVGGVVIIAGVAAYSVTTSIIESTKTSTSTPAIKIRTGPEPRNQTVYTLRSNDNGKNRVIYVGRTKNVQATKARHKANTARKNLYFQEEYSGLTYPEARYMEQRLIYGYKTLNRTNPMYNQINGLSQYNRIKWDVYEAAAIARFGESVTYVGE